MTIALKSSSQVEKKSQSSTVESVRDNYLSLIWHQICGFLDDEEVSLPARLERHQVQVVLQ